MTTAVSEGAARRTPTAGARQLARRNEDSGPPIRVVAADQSYMVRGFLQLTLDGAPDVELTAVCSNRTDLERAIAAWHPDVVVTGLPLPSPGDGAEHVAGRLREAHPRMGVVVLAQDVAPSSVLSLLDKGTRRCAYLLSERVQSREELISAIQTVATGGSVIDPTVVDVLVQARVRAARSRLSELTRREHEVLSKVAHGHSNRAIAEALCLTKRAVEKHVNSIFAKLDLPEQSDVSRRVAATRIFLSESAEG